MPLLPQAPTDETPLPTLESVSPSRKSKASPYPLDSAASSNLSALDAPPATTADTDPLLPETEELEEEASSEGAFNEETGEINWDCPCLGGMAHGPCGEQFRTAFSCFVFSTEEPKGMDCIEHFKTMQGCFREHPEIYGAELEEEEAEDRAVEAAVREARNEAEADAAAAIAPGPGTDANANRQTATLQPRNSDKSGAHAAEVAADLVKETPPPPPGATPSSDSGPINESKQTLPPTPSPHASEFSQPTSEAKAKAKTTAKVPDPSDPTASTEGIILPRASHDATEANNQKSNENEDRYKIR